MAKQYVMSQVPTLRRRRSRFDLSANVKTAINVGDLVPFYCQEVIPGDSMKIEEQRSIYIIARNFITTRIYRQVTTQSNINGVTFLRCRQT